MCSMDAGTLSLEQSQIKIAIIDDDVVFQFMAKSLINRILKNPEILQFENGKDAIDFIMKHRNDPRALPGTIFLDINMPVMNGWEFLDTFRQLPFKEYRPGIHLVSSSVDDQDSLMATHYPEVASYHIKPLSQQQFIDILVSEK